MLSRLWRVKDIETLKREASAESSNALKRTLKIKDLVALGIGAVIGSGIFVTAGLAAAGGGDYIAAGPAVMLSFIVVAVACLFCVLCYAEFASIVPAAGSAYTYAYATLGEYLAWLIAWNLILEYGIGNVAVAISWSGYFGSICANLGFPLPEWAMYSYFAAPPEVIAQAPQFLGIPIVCNLPAIGIILFLTAIIIKGMRESATLNAILVVLKILIILLVIVMGMGHIDIQNWVPFAPNGLAGIQAGAALVFFAYVGVDAITAVAEETENPGRDLPLGMIITLVLCTLLYMAAAAVLTGMVPYTELGTAEPMATAFNMLHMPWVAAIISVGAMVSMAAVLLVFQIAQPRIFFVMARDGLLPQSFAAVHSEFRTPHLTILWTGILVALGAGFMDLGVVIDLCNIGTLFAFILVCVGVLVLRYKMPEVRGKFRTPLVPWIPIAGVLTCLYLIAGMPVMTWVRFGLWMVVGSVIYFAYGYRHSTLNNPLPQGEGAPAEGESSSETLESSSSLGAGEVEPA